MKRIIGKLALIIGTVMTVASLTLFGLTRPGASHAELSGNGLLVTTRNDLAICVETSPDLKAKGHDDVAAVSQAVQELRARETGWSETQYGDSPTVTGSCPDGYVAPPPARRDRGQSVGPGPTKDPAAERLLVFVADLPSSETGAARDVDYAPYEFLCEGDQCWEVTSALFVSPSTAHDPTALAEALRYGLGFVSPLDRYPDGHPDGQGYK